MSDTWIAAEALTDLRPCRELLDPDFDGYKLTLDKLAVYDCSLTAPLDDPPPAEHQISFLQAKRAARRNLLTLDPWQPSCVYFVDARWCVCRVRVPSRAASAPLDAPTDVVQLPGGASVERRAAGRSAPSLQFVSDALVLAADGAGQLLLFESGAPRDAAVCWELLLSEQPLGERVAFELLSCVAVADGHIECLLLHVVESADDEPTMARLDWLTLTCDADATWQLGRHRRLGSLGLPDYAALQPPPAGADTADSAGLVLVTDRAWRWELDTARPLVAAAAAASSEDAASMIPLDTAPDAARVDSYTWSQTLADVTVRFELAFDELREEDVCVTNDGRQLAVACRGRTLLAGALLEPVEPGVCSWTLDDGVLELVLAGGGKARYWERLMQAPSADSWPGREVLSEARAALAVQQEDAAGDSAMDSSLPFNTQELEEVDLAQSALGDSADVCPALVWLDGDAHTVLAAVNLDGHQWLFNTAPTPSAAPALVLRHDVDALVWQSERGAWRHAASFAALGYVQASKVQRRLTVSPGNAAYAALIDFRRHVYLYEQPRALATELRHRTSGRRVARLARQRVLSLEDEAPLLGGVASEEWLLVASATCLYLVYLD